MAVPVRAVVTPPGPGGSGDYATNIALQLARPAGRPPLQVAEILRPHLSRTEGVAAVEITGPGFLNIHLERAAVTALVRRIQGAEGTRDGQSADPLPYGHSDTLAGQVVRLRIPYDIRAEVLADALVRIVASQGGRVEVDHIRPQAADQVNDPGDSDQPRDPGPPRAPADPGPPGAPADPGRTRNPADPGRTSGPATAVGPDAPIDLRPVPAPEDPTPSAPTHSAGRSCIRPSTIVPGSPRTSSCSGPETPSSGSATPTPEPARSPATPQPSASPAPRAPCTPRTLRTPRTRPSRAPFPSPPPTSPPPHHRPHRIPLCPRPSGHAPRPRSSRPAPGRPRRRPARLPVHGAAARRRETLGRPPRPAGACRSRRDGAGRRPVPARHRRTRIPLSGPRSSRSRQPTAEADSRQRKQTAEADAEVLKPEASRAMPEIPQKVVQT